MTEKESVANIRRVQLLVSWANYPAGNPIIMAIYCVTTQSHCAQEKRFFFWYMFILYSKVKHRTSAAVPAAPDFMAEI